MSIVIDKKQFELQVLFIKWCKFGLKLKVKKKRRGKSRDKDNTLVIMKNESLWGVDNKFTICMQKVKSLLKQATPLQICSAPFLNSQEARKI